MRYAFDGNSVSCCFSVWVDESHFFVLWVRREGASVGWRVPLARNPILLISEVPAVSSHVCFVRNIASCLNSDVSD